MKRPSVGIIGGGVNGLCCAWYLLQEGCTVTLMDRDNFKEGCSYINAGMVVPSHFIPLAAPGAVRKGFAWMFHRCSPFRLHPRVDRDLLRWTWLFCRSCTGQHVRRAIPLLRDINQLSRGLYRELAEQGLDFGWRERGLLMLYRTREAEKEEAETARLAANAGVQAEILSLRELRELEPETEINARGGVYFPGDAHLDPCHFMRSMKAFLESRGVIFLSAEVTGFSAGQEKIAEVTTVKGPQVFDEVVIAAGAASASLLKKLAFRLPLQGGKGYSFRLQEEAPRLRIPSILVEGKVAVTPMDGSVLVGGTLELGGLTHAVDSRRVAGIAETFGRFYPRFYPRVYPAISAAISAGMRPCSPDGLPYIGRVKGWENLTLATGHGMMGMSLGPATGKIVSDLICRRQAVMDLRDFSPDRYHYY